MNTQIKTGTDLRPLACYLIINGPLGMSAGKIAAQAFQAMQRLQSLYNDGKGTLDERANFKEWSENKTRTITRIAETTNIFDRALAELPGATMIDEGLTEIPADSATIHASWPIRMSSHRLTKHKKCPLLTGNPIYSKKGD